MNLSITKKINIVIKFKKFNHKMMTRVKMKILQNLIICKIRKNNNF